MHNSGFYFILSLYPWHMSMEIDMRFSKDFNS